MKPSEMLVSESTTAERDFSERRELRKGWEMPRGWNPLEMKHLSKRGRPFGEVVSLENVRLARHLDLVESSQRGSDTFPQREMDWLSKREWVSFGEVLQGPQREHELFRRDKEELGLASRRIVARNKD